MTKNDRENEDRPTPGEQEKERKGYSPPPRRPPEPPEPPEPGEPDVAEDPKDPNAEDG